jgi:hypothetical protein
VSDDKGEASWKRGTFELACEAFSSRSPKLSGKRGHKRIARVQTTGSFRLVLYGCSTVHLLA